MTLNHSLIFKKIVSSFRHDGAGIRYVIFFKGCPLKCKWCHNPEGQKYYPERFFYSDRCIGCRNCQNHCQLELRAELPNLRQLSLPLDCLNCCKCFKSCPQSAIELIGEQLSVSDLLASIRGLYNYFSFAEYKVVYCKSSDGQIGTEILPAKGGVTFSGGEPLTHLSEVIQIASLLKKELPELDIAIDTCGAIELREEIKELTHKQLVNTVLFDIKHVSSSKLKDWTGAHWEMIKNCFEYLVDSAHLNLVVRIPLIPSFNTEISDLEEIVQFLSQFSNQFAINKLASNANILGVSLLPYHDMAEGKYQALGINNNSDDYSISVPEGRIPPISKEAFELAENLFLKAGIPLIYF